MAEQQTIKYAPQCTDMTVDNVIFQTNNVWSIRTSSESFGALLTDEPEKHPLKEFLIKFSVSNGKRPLTLNFKTFCSITSLDYNNGKYVDHPTPEDPSKVTDIKLTAYMITVNNQRDSVSPHPLVAKPKKGKSQTVAPTLPKSQGHEASGALSKKRTKPKYKNHPLRPKNHHPSQRRVLSNPTQGKDQPLNRDLTFTTYDEGTAKTTSCPEGSCMDKDSRGNKLPADMEPLHTTNADLSGTGEPSYKGEPDTQPMLLTYADVRAILLSEDEAQEVDEEVLAAEDDIDEDPHDDKEVRTSSLKQDHPAPSHVQESAFDSSILASKDLTIFFLSLKVDQYYEENIAHKDQSDKLVEASMSSLDRSSTTISDLYKGLNFITQLFKEISNTIKDDPATNQKINEATETFARISSYVTELLSLVKGFDFSALLPIWLGILAPGSFQGRPSLAPSGSVTPTLTLTDIQANVERENATTTTIEEPSSYTEGETEEPRLAIRISSIPSTVIPPTQPTSSILKALKQL
nr:hypothetical protein [Tanacetum cinerariifolium]